MAKTTEEEVKAEKTDKSTDEEEEEVKTEKTEKTSE